MWLYEEKEVISEELPDNAIGFIYMIKNLTNDRFYIGKKLLTKAGVKKPLKLKDGSLSTKRKTSVRKESDWKNYWSSCDELKEDVKNLGKENFKREILFFSECLTTHSYLEDRTMFDYRVLENKNCYNNNIGGKYFKGRIFGKL